MVAMMGMTVFAAAFVASVWVIGAMIVPQWRRIVRLAAGQPEIAFTPLAQLAVAERRIAVRHWATGRVPSGTVTPLRVAA